jgi:hypothetical protein
MNKWIWSKLSTFEYKPGAIAFDAYGSTTGKLNLVPIIPAQQLPEFTNILSGAPFIVYGYSKSASPSEWYITSEKAAYTIYDNNEERLRAIENYMFDLLRRMDESADDINDYLGNASNYSFKWINANMSTSPEPFIQEGGRMGAMVSISYEYTVALDGVTGSSNFGLRV